MALVTIPRECLPRYATPRTKSRATLGGQAAETAALLGTPLMDWQRQVIDVALEIDDRGRFVYREVILTVPRQSGKTTLMLSLILTRAFTCPPQRIVYTAQSRQDARKKWSEDWLPPLEKSPFRKHFKTRLANGDEALLFKNGSRQGLLASTEKSGHGGTLDLSIIDEAFAQADGRLEQASKPAMITRPDPQLWVVSTAGALGKSPYLWGKVQTGRELAQAGLAESVAYFEWSADDDADPADPETWYSAMPALGRTVELSAVEADFRSMEIAEFRRAYLNQWTRSMGDPAIPLKEWAACENAASEINGRVVLAIDATPDRSFATIAAAGVSSDPAKIQIEIVAHGDGTGWVLPRLNELIQEHDVQCVVWDPISAINTLATEGVRADGRGKHTLPIGIEDIPVTTRELGHACGLLFQAATEEPRELVHLGDPLLAASLDGAVMAPLGDTRKWNRKGSAVDISPLVSATLAFWGAKTQNISPQVWDLNEIVAKLRERQATEQTATGEVGDIHSPEPNDFPTNFVPL